MLCRRQAGRQPHRSLGAPALRGLTAATENAETDFHRLRASQERSRQGPARPLAARLDRTNRGVRVNAHSSTRLLFRIAFPFVASASLHVQALCRHGALVSKGDAGFSYLAAEGGFAKADGLD